ncbi:MAG: hypothetical protein ACTHM8_07360, partial [Sphingomonas sp.]
AMSTRSAELRGPAVATASHPPEPRNASRSSIAINYRLIFRKSASSPTLRSCDGRKPGARTQRPTQRYIASGWRASFGCAAPRTSRARAALAAAFGRFEQLIPYALDLSSKDIEGFGKKDREKIFAAGFNGTLIARNASDPDDVLLWSDGLIQVQAVS